MSDPIAWLNGRTIPQTQLAISPTDAGFVMGIAVAEQLRTFRGQLFAGAEHLERFGKSLRLVGLHDRVSLDEVAQAVEQVVSRNIDFIPEVSDLGVTLFATPGIYAAYTAGDDRPADASAPPTVCVHTYQLPFRLWAAKYRDGQGMAISSLQQIPPACWPRSLKCRSRMHYYLADRQAAAVKPGARAILLDDEGYVNEASTANVLAYFRQEGLVSPPLEDILPGVSLQFLSQLAAQHRIPWRYRRLTPAQLLRADEVLLTSTPYCLLPVVEIDHHRIADGYPGAIFHQLLQAWSGAVGVSIENQARACADLEQIDGPPR